MAFETVAELRARAEYLRNLAEDGADLRLKDALLSVADDFDDEAAQVETLEAVQTVRDGEPKQMPRDSERERVANSRSRSCQISRPTAGAPEAG